MRENSVQSENCSEIIFRVPKGINHKQSFSAKPLFNGQNLPACVGFVSEEAVQMKHSAYSRESSSAMSDEFEGHSNSASKVVTAHVLSESPERFSRGFAR